MTFVGGRVGRAADLDWEKGENERDETKFRQSPAPTVTEKSICVSVHRSADLAAAAADDDEHHIVVVLARRMKNVQFAPVSRENAALYSDCSLSSEQSDALYIHPRPTYLCLLGLFLCIAMWCAIGGIMLFFSIQKMIFDCPLFPHLRGHPMRQPE